MVPMHGGPMSVNQMAQGPTPPAPLQQPMQPMPVQQMGQPVAPGQPVPNGYAPQGQMPPGHFPSDFPTGQYPQQGQYPQGQLPPQGQVPQGQVPQGQVPQGQVPQGQVPQGQVPQGQVPQPNGAMYGAAAGQPAQQQPVSAPPSHAPGQQASAPYGGEAPGNRPVSVPPPPPPGITPIVPAQRGALSPAESGQPFRPTLTTAALNSARAARQATGEMRQQRAEQAGRAGMSATDVVVPVPTPRPEARTEPGSRANWPLVGNADDDAPAGNSFDDRDHPAEQRTGDNRITPPWLADDLPQEPPMLRLVEPPSLGAPARRGDLADLPQAPPSLRLVEPEEPGRAERNGRRSSLNEPSFEPPVSAEEDGDLLIFADVRSAWFSDPEAVEDWSSPLDDGWRAAEQVAAEPTTGDATQAGLPRRVPQANLVPGAPMREERPLRIVRDANTIAAHTTNYFKGWRRGQEINGFAVGGRPGRESAHGWDFSRDIEEHDDDRDFQYRSAGRRS